jgi:hypothetical protein
METKTQKNNGHSAIGAYGVAPWRPDFANCPIGTGLFDVVPTKRAHSSRRRDYSANRQVRDTLACPANGGHHRKSTQDEN